MRNCADAGLYIQKSKNRTRLRGLRDKESKDSGSVCGDCAMKSTVSEKISVSSHRMTDRYIRDE